MSYRLHLGDIYVATYEIAVGDVTQVAGKQAIVVQTHAKATGVVKLVTNIDDTFTSWIDTTTSRPLLWAVEELSKTNHREHTEVRLHERQGDTIPIDFHIDDGPKTSEPQKASLPDVWDYNAYLIALRGWDVPTGSTVRTEVLRGRYLWRIETTVGAREKLVTEMGDLPSVRFDSRAYKLTRDGKRMMDSEERDFTIWISDDADRVPLLNIGATDYGTLKIKIVDYQPGTGQRLRK